MTRPTRQQIKNRKERDRKKRKKLRDKLEAQGVPEDKIERIIEERRRLDRAARHGYTIDSYDPENDEGFYPDDSGYKPSPGDPLLRGAARATGMTKKVARRPNTITDWQYEIEVGRDR